MLEVRLKGHGGLLLAEVLVESETLHPEASQCDGTLRAVQVKACRSHHADCSYLAA